jgi:hypothetical protein
VGHPPGVDLGDDLPERHSCRSVAWVKTTANGRAVCSRRMIVGTSPRLATIGPRLRNAVLVLFALFVAHDAIFVAQFGVGDGFAQAMSDGGHDGYWLPVTLGVGIAAGLIFLAALGVLSRLNRQAGGRRRDLPPGPSYLNELASTWLRLFPTVGLLFALQENVEHFVIDGHLVGLGVVLGPVVLPVLAATTFGLAALGSLLRWRIRLLEACIAAARRQSYARPEAARQPQEWAAIAAAAPHRWTCDRRDAGRAPPRVLPRNVFAIA